jgi:hypothetical protein
MDDFRNDDVAEVADGLRIDNAERDLDKARTRLCDARQALDANRERLLAGVEHVQLMNAYYARLREFGAAEKRVLVLKGAWEGQQYRDWRRAERLREVCDR